MIKTANPKRAPRDWSLWGFALAVEQGPVSLLRLYYATSGKESTVSFLERYPGQIPASEMVRDRQGKQAVNDTVFIIL